MIFKSKELFYSMRYKEFNTNRVLEKCINLFWNKGFGACSIKHIVQATGVNRFSLYNEFNNKEGILYAAIELYQNRYSKKVLTSPIREETLQEVLLVFFKNFLIDTEAHPPGCFTIHIATELADHDDKIKNILDNYMAELESNFKDILQNYQYTNSLIEFYAKHLTGLFCSSMCFCVIQTYNERLSQISTGISVLLNKRMEYATHA